MPTLSRNLENTEKTRKPLPLWRNRDFLLLLSGQTISSLGTQVSQPAFLLLVLWLTHSPAQAGLTVALRGLPYTLLCLPAGVLVDRWNRKHVMILSDVGRALALGSIPVAFALGHLTLVQMYLVSLIEGTLFVFFNMAETSAIPHIVAREQLTTATGQNEVLYSTSLLVGPSIGGILYSMHALLPFLSDAVSYAASVVSLFFIKAKFQEQRTPVQQNLWAEVKEGFVWLWNNPLIRFIAILTCGLTTPGAGYQLILIVLAQHQHASVATIGFILAGAGIGSIVGAMLASPLERRLGFAKVMIGSTWLLALSWLLYIVAPNPLALGIINGIGYSAVPVFMVVQYSYRLALIPDRLLGRVNSVFRLIAFGSQPIGLALTGLLLQSFGPVPAVLILFAPQFVLAIAVTLNKHVRQARPLKELPVPC